MSESMGRAVSYKVVINHQTNNIRGPRAGTLQQSKHQVNLQPPVPPKSCCTCGTLIADEFALWHLGEPKALQVESTTALRLTQQQLPWLLADLWGKKHPVSSEQPPSLPIPVSNCLCAGQDCQQRLQKNAVSTVSVNSGDFCIATTICHRVPATRHQLEQILHWSRLPDICEL